MCQIFDVIGSNIQGEELNKAYKEKPNRAEEEENTKNNASHIERIKPAENPYEKQVIIE